MMYLADIVHSKDIAVHPTDKVYTVLDKMADIHLAQLPVVREQDYIGFVREDDLLDVLDPNVEVMHSPLNYAPIYLQDQQHVYDALQFFHVYKTDFLPILDQDKYFEGVVFPRDILSAVDQLHSIHEPGAIIVLELGQHDNALSHIAHIVELDNAVILSAATRNMPDTAKMQMTLKINKSTIGAILASLNRHNYTVLATFNDGNSYDDTQDRYDHLMNYINI